MKKNIAVEGVMGVGKTTLVNALRSKFDIEAVEQDFEHNICLDDFYASMDCAFQKQMIFLYSNYHLLMKAQSAFPAFFSDFCFERSLAISKSILRKKDFEFFRMNYLYLNPKIHLKKMVIFLHGSPKRIVQNIKKRERKNELTVCETFVATQQQSLLQSLDSFNAYRLILVNIDKTDVLSNSFLDYIIPQIDTFLNGGV
nr:deoxynucleoside kinase [Flavonifractor sp. An135]